MVLHIGKAQIIRAYTDPDFSPDFLVSQFGHALAAAAHLPKSLSTIFSARVSPTQI